MSERAKRMDLLVMLAQREEDKYVVAFQKKQLAIEEQEIKLEELKGYYENYNQQFSQNTQNVRVEELISARGLLSRLADAQNFQMQQVIIAKEQRDVAKKQWQEKRLKHQSLIDLQSRFKIEELAENDRAEQKKADEWSSLAFNHKR